MDEWILDKINIVDYCGNIVVEDICMWMRILELTRPL